MGKLISDAQIYMLLWAEQATHGAFNELMNPPSCIEMPGGQIVRLLRTACDRLGMLGLWRRGFLDPRGHGLWQITDAGRAELRREPIMRRIATMAKATAAANARASHDDENDSDA